VIDRTSPGLGTVDALAAYFVTRRPAPNPSALARKLFAWTLLYALASALAVLFILRG
jgi:hypothetical protein